MPLVGKVGRRHWLSRLAVAVLYGLLTVGAVSTVYPFLLMVSTGFKGPTDQNDNRLVPAFWGDDAELLKKAVDDKYSGDAGVIASTRIGAEADEAAVRRYREFLLGLPQTHWQAGFRTPANHVTSRLNLRYQGWLRGRYRDIDALNRAYTELNTGFQSVAPPTENLGVPGWKPKPGPKQDDWIVFKATLPAEFRVPVREGRLWQEFLRTKFANKLDDVPAGLRGEAKGFDEIRTGPTGPLGEEFRAGRLPASMAGGRTVEALWGGPLPVEAEERLWVRENAQALRTELSTRNYQYVLETVLLNGRAVLNTVVFCALAILAQLTVNPLAAYALSRFPMKATAQILLFLLATMAFPAEVAMIPSFLLLKDLHLLNTFAALVLPAAASGYMIFLLKGFFDSLPQEVFDSGQVDGAPEWVMMLRLALPLSKPVLGYLALLAFMGAYGAFLYAFLVCQDSRMWTLMVYVYQLQLSAPKAVTMAAVSLVALPTLVVFLLAQRVIMRGIVLPGER
jgi:multiple sugar transport system permease protein